LCSAGLPRRLREACGFWLDSYAACLFFAATLVAQSYPPGPQVLTFWSSVDDSDQPYAVYVPQHFDPAKKYQLVISLHGAYSTHRLNLRRVFGEGDRLRETDAEASRYFPPLRDVDYIVIRVRRISRRAA